MDRSSDNGKGKHDREKRQRPEEGVKGIVEDVRARPRSGRSRDWP